MIHNHHSWTFPAHKMIPLFEVRDFIKQGEVIWRVSPTQARVAKRVHRKRSRRWLKQQTLREIAEMA